MTYESKLVQRLFADYDTYKQDFDQMKHQVAHSKAIYKGAPVPYLHIPKLYNDADMATFSAALDGIHDICERTIALYLEKPEIRALFGFDERLEALILQPHHYKTTVPMGRFDIFYYGPGDFQFCELNADGASAMNEDHELSQILMNSALMNSIKDEIQVEKFELFHSWVSEVKTIYAEYLENTLLDTAHAGTAHAAEISSLKPLVAILDFIDKGSSIEFEVFKRTFEEDGFDAIIIDPRDLKISDGHLMADGRKIDIIYRRLVTKDLMDRYDEVPVLIEGILAGKTCFIGSLKTQIIHTKRFFEVLYAPEIQPFFTAEQLAFIKKHVPFTRPLKRDEHYQDYLAHKDAYIIKPVDYYASKGVCAGKDYTDQQWAALLEEKCCEDFIIQKYCPVALVDNVLEMPDGGLEQRTFKTITGLFTYNRKLAGVYVRAGLNAIISGLHDGYTMSTLHYKNRK